MYLNTFLLMFGLDPDNFVNELVEPMESDEGAIIYNLRQRTDNRKCPKCNRKESIIHNYFFTQTSFTSNDGKPIIIRIKKARFKCKQCNSTYTLPVLGIERYAKIGTPIKNLIIKEFYKQKSFSIIAKDYHVSTHQVMNIFDRSFPNIRRGSLPNALCIDEIGFETEDGSYAAILYDHDKRIVIDVIKNRRIDYLRHYFIQFSFRERSNVKYFVSDLYEGYATIKEEFFFDAIHIADMFHVLRLLKVEVSRLRVNTYKQCTDEGDPERNFMKLHWDYFEKYLNRELADKPYYCQKEKYEYTSYEMMRRCLVLNQTFWDAYMCLQDFYEYWRCDNFDQAILHIKKVSNQLIRTENENLMKVGRTFWRWRVEIANAITVKNMNGKRYSNGPAEGLNNAIKTIIKDANGYRNFERLRKRILLVLNYGKDPSL